MAESGNTLHDALKNNGATVYHTIGKSQTQSIVFSKTVFKGNEYLDIRIWYVSKDNVWLPSKKGISFKIELVYGMLIGLTKMANQQTLDDVEFPTEFYELLENLKR